MVVTRSKNASKGSDPPASSEPNDQPPSGTLKAQKPSKGRISKPKGSSTKKSIGEKKTGQVKKEILGTVLDPNKATLEEQKPIDSKFVIEFEHCFVVNKNKPRRNTFDIKIVGEGKESLIWSGIEKGPPRKLKFPTIEDIKDEIESFVGN
ncbi:hypothetical protein BB558_007003 [Smittium angustum]|uniref:Selenoprotein H n=1 Tax=Smittium angustum TaxID=133377 RepID=A0A2U1IW90_SMIAN|nr:hypothetical protein BB558_007003 [Smittium angustum]